MTRPVLVSAVPTAALLLLLGVSCSQSPLPPTQAKKQVPKAAPSIPMVKVTPAVQAKAQTPKPGARAVRKDTADSFGRGKASITVKGHPGGVNHSFWTEELDVDGAGNPVQVDEAWDNHHKVLYLSRDRVFQCGNGQTADGATLMAVYGAGNTLGKPTGSGWWVAELDEGECAVETAGIYGCHFDAHGENHDCGSATVQADQDDVVIVPLPGTTPGTPSDGSLAPSSPSTPPSAPPPAGAPAGDSK